jgi:hypothetical protein
VVVHYRLTAAYGVAESLIASEIQTIFVAPDPSLWRRSDVEALRRADAGPFGFDKRCGFETSDAMGFAEYVVSGGHKRYGIPPASAP